MRSVALKLFMVIVLLAGLSACSSGGGGGGAVIAPPATVVGGTVTDTSLAPVEGATVEIVGETYTTTTDSAGRYLFLNLPEATEFTLKFTGPDPSYFPVFAKATLTGFHPTVLDVYLTRAGNNPVPTVDAAAGGAVASTAFIGGAQTSTFTLTQNELEDSSGTLYTGSAGVYIAPIDVGKMGNGIASYQVTLDNVFAALTASSTIYEPYGSAAVRVVDGASNDLGLVTPSTSTLTLPIPESPAELRTSAPSSATLIYLDEATGSWVEDGTAPVDDIAAPTMYTGTISRPGIWQAVLKHDFTTLAEITGQITFNDGTAAAGATVYVNGVDYAYQNQTTTDANGMFVSLARETGTVSIHCVVSANGAQWTHEVEFVDPATADIVLPFAPPVLNGVATQTVMVDSRDSVVGNAPDVVGYIVGSGRQVSDAAGVADVTAVNVADFSFVANETDLGTGLISVTPSASGSTIQAVAGQSFETLAVAPTTGYIPDPPDTPTSFAITLDSANLGFTGLPVLFAVKTAQGNFAKVSIDSVSNTTSGTWQITFRHAFSLTGNF